MTYPSIESRIVTALASRRWLSYGALEVVTNTREDLTEQANLATAWGYTSFCEAHFVNRLCASLLNYNNSFSALMKVVKWVETVTILWPRLSMNFCSWQGLIFFAFSECPYPLWAHPLAAVFSCPRGRRPLVTSAQWKVENTLRYTSPSAHLHGVLPNYAGDVDFRLFTVSSKLTVNYGVINLIRFSLLVIKHACT
jgi:hypothetical protein